MADYLHLFLPPIVKLFDSQDVPIEIRKQALETIERLSDVLDFSEFASRIIHPLVRCLETTPDLRPTAMDTLSALVYQLGMYLRQRVCMIVNMTSLFEQYCRFF